MDFFTQAETWVAANQVVVMGAFLSAFVVFHLLILVNAVVASWIQAWPRPPFCNRPPSTFLVQLSVNIDPMSRVTVCHGPST